MARPPGESTGDVELEAPAEADVPGNDEVSARINALIDRGLERYGEGDLEGALGEWDHALALDPENQRAQEYVSYVNDNFDALSEQFAAAREGKEAALSSGVPVPEIPEEVSGAYDLVQLGEDLQAQEAEPVPLDVSRTRAIEDPMAPFEPEWAPEDLPAEPLPPPPPGEAAADDDEEPLDLGGEDIPQGDSRPYDPDDPDNDEGEVLVLEADEPPEPGEDPDEVTMPGGDEPPPLPDQPQLVPEAIDALRQRVQPVVIRPRQAGEGTSPGTVPGFLPNALPAPPTVATPAELLLDDLGSIDDRLDRSGDGLDIDMSDEAAVDSSDDSSTRAAGKRLPGIGEPLDVSALGLSGDDTGEATFPAGGRRSLDLMPEEMPTIERHAALGLVGDAQIDLDAPPPPRVRTGTTGPAVIVDQSLLTAAHETGEDEPTHMRARLPSGVHDLGGAPVDNGEEAIRRRISDLLTLARQAAERGDIASAVSAAEAASAQDPDGTIGPVMLHRHRDLLYRVYEAHIGEMTQVPLLAVPIHQIAAETLDHRAGFLLSRIDGMLSFEDILDVSGMPRLDAYRILSHLLKKGFIEVR